MLGGQGYGRGRGASVMRSGSAGTGKSSLRCMAVDAACRRGERALLFAFEESTPQMLRNRRSIGVDPQPWLDSGLLHIQARRPTFQGFEQHLLTVHEAVDRFDPAPVLIEPISKLTVDAHRAEVKPLLMRLIDLLRQRGITALYTCLTGGQGPDAADDPLLGVSSLMDIWLLLRNLESDRFYHRSLCVLKSRGMAHSNQVRGLLPSPQGV